MASPNGQPTLLVFTRGAERETRRRRLLPSRLAPVELALHHRCLDATIAAGRTAGCTVMVSSATPGARCRKGDVVLAQRGGGFGSRLRAAAREAHDSSDGPVVIVGTDTPGLGAAHLTAAMSELARRPDSVVVGPAADGGFYLLASQRPLDRVLARVRWRRRDTLDSLLAALAEAGLEVSLLEPLADLDRPQDLTRWASGSATPPWTALVALVRRALAALRRLAVPAELGRPRQALTVRPTGRAPPATA